MHTEFVEFFESQSVIRNYLNDRLRKPQNEVIPGREQLAPEVGSDSHEMVSLALFLLGFTKLEAVSSAVVNQGVIVDDHLHAIDDIGGEVAAEGILFLGPHFDHLERVDGVFRESEAHVVGGMSEHETQQPLLHQFFLEEHLIRIDLNEGFHEEAHRVKGRDERVDEGDLLVGHVEIIVGVDIGEGEDEKTLFG